MPRITTPQAEALRLRKRKAIKAKAKEEALKASVEAQVRLVEVRHGVDGERGSQGTPGLPGTPGASGSHGSDGRDGKDGVTEVIHVTDVPIDTFLTQEQWKEEVAKLRAIMDRGANAAPYVSIKQAVHYIPITTTPYILHRDQLKPGTTILGVNFPGDVTITLPVPKKEHIVIVNDESAVPGSNTITVVTS